MFDRAATDLRYAARIAIRRKWVSAAIVLRVAFGMMVRGFLVPGVGGAATVFGAVSATLVAVGFTAAYLPARRASRVDPMVALRDPA